MPGGMLLLVDCLYLVLFAIFCTAQFCAEHSATFSIFADGTINIQMRNLFFQI